jgi:hypothetical protein
LAKGNPKMLSAICNPPFSTTTGVAKGLPRGCRENRPIPETWRRLLIGPTGRDKR